MDSGGGVRGDIRRGAGTAMAAISDVCHLWMNTIKSCVLYFFMLLWLTLRSFLIVGCQYEQIEKVAGSGKEAKQRALGLLQAQTASAPAPALTATAAKTTQKSALGWSALPALVTLSKAKAHAEGGPDVIFVIHRSNNENSVVYKGLQGKGVRVLWIM